MKRDWKPGDVAMVTVDGKERPAVRAENGRAWIVEPAPIPTPPRVSVSARPLAVIDPENREQVERLIRLVDIAAKRTDLLDADIEAPRRHNFMAALREFANPTPKPEEPTGLGAVVEDDAGRIYTRYETETEPQPWWQSAHGPEHDVVRRFAWPNIDAVRVLSEGVTP